MLDRLADKVEANVDSIAELRENQSAILQTFVVEHEENRQFRLQYERDREQDREKARLEWEEYLTWKRETNQRFNILLEEVRELNKKVDS